MDWHTPDRVTYWLEAGARITMDHGKVNVMSTAWSPR
jgi:hypothetical protein